jgi:hypothetical protein
MLSIHNRDGTLQADAAHQHNGDLAMLWAHCGVNSPSPVGWGEVRDLFCTG